MNKRFVEIHYNDHVYRVTIINGRPIKIYDITYHKIYDVPAIYDLIDIIKVKIFKAIINE